MARRRTQAKPLLTGELERIDGPVRALEHSPKLSDTNGTEQSFNAAPERRPLKGRVLALDMGQKRVGVAVSDENRLAVRSLASLPRTNWKELLRAVAQLLQALDAREMVIGLPLMLDGTEGAAAIEARRLARNFKLSLDVPVSLQDERLTSREAEKELRADGFDEKQTKARVDSRAAAIILRDFLARLED